MEILAAFNGVFSIILLAAIGFFASRKNILNTDNEAFISKFAIRITIPFLMFSNGYQYFTVKFIKSVSINLAAAFLMISCSYALGHLAAVVFKLKQSERGTCAMMFALSNTIFIGLPVCTYYFGSEGVPSVIVYYIANTTIFWTIGTMFVAKDAGKEIKWGFQTLKNIFSPQVVSFFLGGAVGIIGIPFPNFVSSVISSVGNMTTPLVTILAGAVLARIGIKSAFKLNRLSVISLIGRFVVSPAIALLIVCVLPVPTLTGNVFVAQSAMPVMNQSMLIAKYYGVNEETVTKTLAASILIMTAVLPPIVLLAKYIIP